MRRRHERSDAEWARLARRLPPRKPGAPRKDDRLVINGILWKLATGAPWRDLPERYGPWPSVDTRFRRWTRAGVWDRIVAAVQRQTDAAGQLDWRVHCGEAGKLLRRRLKRHQRADPDDRLHQPGRPRPRQQCERLIEGEKPFAAARAGPVGARQRDGRLAWDQQRALMPAAVRHRHSALRAGRARDGRHRVRWQGIGDQPRHAGAAPTAFRRPFQSRRRSPAGGPCASLPGPRTRRRRRWAPRRLRPAAGHRRWAWEPPRRARPAQHALLAPPVQNPAGHPSRLSRLRVCLTVLQVTPRGGVV